MTMMLVQQCDLQLGDFVWTGGDCHLYLNHFAQADLQLTRTPRAPPRIVFKRKPASILDYHFEDIEIVGYESDAPIKAPIAV